MSEERQFHPVADIFPMMSEREFADLVEDVAANGLRESIWLHGDGRIIDGRNRYRACIQAGVEPVFRTYSGDDAGLVGFVVSLNLHRRHLNESQRAMIAARIANMSVGRPAVNASIEAFTQADSLLERESSTTETAAVPAVTQAQAAELLNVSRTGVQRAHKVQEQAVPELIEKVDAGRISVSTAAAIAEAPAEEQREVIAADNEREIVRRANEIKRRKKEQRAQEKQAAFAAATVEAARLPQAADLRQGDFREVLADLADGSVDAIVTDPPYPAEFLPLYSDLSKLAARVLRPGGICAVMVGQSYLPELYARLTENLTYHWTMAYLTPGGQAVQVWQRKTNTFWKPIILLTNGDYTGDWFGDVAKSAVNDNDKRFHEWGQSESGMVDLIERLTRPGDLVVDPFLGAGTTGVAAIATARRFIGCDVDGAHVNAADIRIRQAAA